MKLVRLIGVVSLALTLAACAVLEGPPGVRLRVEGATLYLDGQIDVADRRRFLDTLAANPQLEVVVLGHVPGSIDERAVRDMGRAIRSRGLETRLTQGSQIYSGGVDLFVAGAQRSVAPGAIIGVHAWADGFRSGNEYPPDSPKHAALRAYTEEMLGSDAFYWFTLAVAPNDGIHLMSRAEMQRFGLITN